MAFSIKKYTQTTIHKKGPRDTRSTHERVQMEKAEAKNMTIARNNNYSSKKNI